MSVITHSNNAKIASFSVVGENAHTKLDEESIVVHTIKVPGVQLQRWHGIRPDGLLGNPFYRDFRAQGQAARGKTITLRIEKGFSDRNLTAMLFINPDQAYTDKERIYWAKGDNKTDVTVYRGPMGKVFD